MNHKLSVKTVLAKKNYLQPIPDSTTLHLSSIKYQLLTVTNILDTNKTYSIGSYRHIWWQYSALFHFSEVLRIMMHNTAMPLQFTAAQFLLYYPYPNPTQYAKSLTVHLINAS